MELLQLPLQIYTPSLSIAWKPDLHGPHTRIVLSSFAWVQTVRDLEGRRRTRQDTESPGSFPARLRFGNGCPPLPKATAPRAAESGVATALAGAGTPSLPRAPSG